MAWNATYLLLRDPNPGNGTQVWTYRDTVAPAAFDAAGYIPDGGKRGMRIGDRVEYTQVDNQDTPTSITAASIHIVMTVTAATGAVNLSDATAMTVTNTD
jgi:hypothetical protein